MDPGGYYLYTATTLKMVQIGQEQTKPMVIAGMFFFSFFVHGARLPLFGS